MSFFPIIKQILFREVPVTVLHDYLSQDLNSDAFSRRIRAHHLSDRILKPNDVLFDFIVQYGTKSDKRNAWKALRDLIKRRKKYGSYELKSFKKAAICNLITYAEWEK